MTTRGFLLGKFMPPHAGHVALIEAAQALVDELTVLVCWLPDDPIAGETRLGWMRALFPACRVLGHGEVVPQEPDDSAEFWPVWRGIVRAAHPEPIDYVFAGEGYGARLAQELGGRFVPLGGRVLGMADALSGLSASAVRADPAAHWALLPPPVQVHYRRRVCLHGAESTGKSTLAAQLAQRLGAIVVGEYGRSHCEAHRDPLTMADLLLIGRAQQAMIAAAERWAGPILLADTDALMTAAWCEMLLGERPPRTDAGAKGRSLPAAGAGPALDRRWHPHVRQSGGPREICRDNRTGAGRCGGTLRAHIRRGRSAAGSGYGGARCLMLSQTEGTIAARFMLRPLYAGGLCKEPSCLGI